MEVIIIFRMSHEYYLSIWQYDRAQKDVQVIKDHRNVQTRFELD